MFVETWKQGISFARTILENRIWAIIISIPCHNDGRHQLFVLQIDEKNITGSAFKKIRDKKRMINKLVAPVRVACGERNKKAYQLSHLEHQYTRNRRDYIYHT
jgi:tRNA(Ile2) C34 agmatinyltransferase TiaS